MMRISVSGCRVIQVAISVVASMWVSAGISQTWDVRPDGSGDAPTIQAAIDSSFAGDTVRVDCGTYFESGITMKSGVVLTSQTGDPGCVTIDAQWNDRVFDCFGCGAKTEIRGFTATHGQPHGVEPGGGIRVVSCSLKVVDCFFVANRAVAGAGAFSQDGYTLFRGCSFIRGKGETGAGMQCWQSAPNITECVFAADSCTFSGTLFCAESSPYVLACTFCGNFADGGSGIFCTSVSNPIVERTIFAYGGWLDPIYCGPGVPPQLVCCDIFGNQSGDWVGCIADQGLINGNFSADPLFCGVADGDFRVESCSPCLDRQHPGGWDCDGGVGAFGMGCECGTATEPATWGAIKAIYR